MSTPIFGRCFWMIAGVGGEWRVEDLDATSSLYQVSAAGAG
jgi:hypothetical protein